MSSGNAFLGESMTANTVAGLAIERSKMSAMPSGTKLVSDLSAKAGFVRHLEIPWRVSAGEYRTMKIRYEARDLVLELITSYLQHKGEVK